MPRPKQPVVANPYSNAIPDDLPAAVAEIRALRRQYRELVKSNQMLRAAHAALDRSLQALFPNREAEIEIFLRQAEGDLARLELPDFETPDISEYLGRPGQV